MTKFIDYESDPLHGKTVGNPPNISVEINEFNKNNNISIEIKTVKDGYILNVSAKYFNKDKEELLNILERFLEHD